VNYDNITEVVGLDLSLTGTGVALGIAAITDLFDGRRRIDAAGRVGMDRLAHIRDEVLTGCKETTLAIIEGYAFGKIQGMAALGELGGVVKLALHERGIPFVIVAPASLKKFVAGKGNADKAVMIKEVFKRFGVDTNDHNIADAVGLMYIGRALCGWYEPTTEAQRQVIEEIKTGKRAKKAELNLAVA
jgi:Holliday junction resolvasome RuvABC endonuclease subunit